MYGLVILSVVLVTARAAPQVASPLVETQEQNVAQPRANFEYHPGHYHYVPDHYHVNAQSVIPGSPTAYGRQSQGGFINYLQGTRQQTSVQPTYTVTQPAHVTVSQTKPTVYYQPQKVTTVQQPHVYVQQPKVIEKHQYQYQPQIVEKHHYQPQIVEKHHLHSQQNYDQSHSYPIIGIIRRAQEIDYDGTFNYLYETENGINAEARGFIKNAGVPDEEIQVMSGSYSYTAPDGTPITTNWYADETGFHAEGEHLPTPPPIPAEIARSLEYINSLPPSKEDQVSRSYGSNPRLDPRFDVRNH